ncbi:AMP-binding protein, partial [Streptomyces sp900105755]|uniref:AMP-binding protein n=1 Tax=Streptomyces sp. 900105755 TaxID=3154389 RepID=UPI0033238B12
HRAKVSLVLGRPIPGHPSLEDVPDRAGPVPDVNAPGDLAYVIATSGSTGTPKFVMIEHRGLAHLARAQRVFFGPLSPHTRVLLFAHPAFDAALFDVVLALTNGVRLDIPDVAIHSGEPLAQVLTDRRITHAVLPAAVLRTLTPGGFPDLEVLISMGDVCLPETARGWAPHLRFVNGYGPTETTICATLEVWGTLVHGASVRFLARPCPTWRAPSPHPGSAMPPCPRPSLTPSWRNSPRQSTQCGTSVPAVTSWPWKPPCGCVPRPPGT